MSSWLLRSIFRTEIYSIIFGCYFPNFNYSTFIISYSLRHHHKNKLRMLTHRWKKLGLPDPVSGNRKEHICEQSHKKKQLAMKTNSLLKITPIQASQAAAQRENMETDGSHCLSSNNSEAELSEGIISDKHSSYNTSGSSECHTDLSDEEQESIEMSKWAMELDLKPEPFDEDLDLDYHFTETAFYPEVLPASLLDSTQNLSSECLDVIDPCLASVIARLIELERLQAATVQKERAKLARPHPATANTRNKQPRKNDLSGCKTRISKDAECNSVMCSFTKLTVCPNSSCRCRNPTCPKPGQGGRSKLPHPSLPKCPDSMSGKCKTAESGLPNFSENLKVPQMPNRTKSSKTQRSSMSAKKATVPNRKT